MKKLALRQKTGIIPKSILPKTVKVKAPGEVSDEKVYQELRNLAKTLKDFSPTTVKEGLRNKFGGDFEITLYRGINKFDTPSPFESDPLSKIGKFWSPNKAHAEIFARRGGESGKIFKVKVKASDLLNRNKAKIPPNQVELTNVLQKKAKEVFSSVDVTGEEFYNPQQVLQEAFAKAPAGFVKRNPVEIVTQALKEAGPIRSQQDKIFSFERAKKFKAFGKAGEGVSGVEGAKKQLSALGGEMTKKDFQSLASQLSKQDMDYIVDMVKTSGLNAGEQASAYDGLFRLFEGRIPQAAQIEKLSRVYPQDLISTLLKNDQ